MGWSSGSAVMGGIIEAVKANVPDEETRVRIYRKVIDVLSDLDWDTKDECLGDDPAYDKIYNEMYPPDEE